jgi:rhodanese-related sulfurtransferase
MWFWKRQKTIVIKPDEVAVKITEGQPPVIVDVRSEKEFQAGHLPGAINIPLGELEQRQVELDPAAPTVFY